MAIIVLFLWKAPNILGSYRRRRRRITLPKLSFLILVLLLGTALITGVLWAHRPFYFLAFSGVSWHIYVSLAALPLLLWHSLHHRWAFRLRFWAQRRSFLRLGALSVAGLLLWRVDELLLGLVKLPGARRRFTGSYEADSFTGNAFPLTSWLNDNPASLETDQ